MINNVCSYYYYFLNNVKYQLFFYKVGFMCICEKTKFESQTNVE